MANTASERAAPITLRTAFSSRRRHTRLQGDWSSDVCSSDGSSSAAPVMTPGPREERKRRTKPGFFGAAPFAWSLTGFSVAIRMFWWTMFSSDCLQAVQRLQKLPLLHPQCQAHPSVGNFLNGRASHSFILCLHQPVLSTLELSGPRAG